MTEKRYSTVKYMLVELEVRDDDHARFAALMPDIIGRISKRYGWEFVYGAYPVSGRMNKFVHIWRINNEDQVMKLMVDGSIRITDPDATDEQKEFGEKYQQIQKLIKRTRHVFMASLPHDPTQLGEQRDIIVVDKQGELSLIQTTDLDAQAVPTIDPVPNTPLYNYLNSGVACGVLSLPNEPKSLFFNLASLKPISVFQSQNLKREGGATVVDASFRALAKSGGDAVLLAMPNAKVYKLDQAALSRVAGPIPQDEQAKTNEILQPLIDGKVPIATIPTPQVIAIGEGCLCFVVNIQALDR